MLVSSVPISPSISNFSKQLCLFSLKPLRTFLSLYFCLTVYVLILFDGTSIGGAKSESEQYVSHRLLCDVKHNKAIGDIVGNGVRNVYILFSKSELPIAAENQEIMDLVEPSTPLPPWFTEEDLAIYGSLYEKSGFRTVLKVPYRSFHEDFDIPNPKIEVPAMLIMGEKDYVLNFPGNEDFIRSGKVRNYAPDYEIALLPEGTHFSHEQLPDQVNQLILTFLNKHT